MGERFPKLSHATVFGYFGVDLFFVISGFVILMTAWGATVPRFVASRVSRLYPGYWFAVLATGVLLFATHGLIREVTWPQIVANLTMFQGAFDIKDVSGVYWTLWVELRFYIVLGIMVAVGITRLRIELLCFCWPVVALIAQLSDRDLLKQITVSSYAPLFCAGMAIFLLRTDLRSLLGWFLLAWNSAFGVVLSGRAASGMIQRSVGWRPEQWATAAAILVSVGLVMMVTLTAVSRINWTWLTTAGLLTYPLYLIHEQFGYWMIENAHSLLGVPLTMAATVTFCVVLAWAINRTVERWLAPALRRGVLRLMTWRPRRRTAALEVS